MDALVGCLEEFDPSVKEAAAWALGYIARHNAELSQAVVDAIATTKTGPADRPVEAVKISSI